MSKRPESDLDTAIGIMFGAAIGALIWLLAWWSTALV